MRLVFMGTPDFASYQLECLINAGHEIMAVVTQADKAKGRSKALLPPPVKEVALREGIKVYQPERLRDSEVVEELKKLAPEAIIVAAYGQILPKEVLDIPKYGCINIHASLLPKYRGAAPIQQAVIDGLTVTGVTTMYMGEGLDTGDIIDQTTVKIAEDETGGSLFDKLSKAGGKLIITTLDKILNGTSVRTPQNEADSSYARMLKKEDGFIDFTKSAVSIERLIRGLNPWPSAYTLLEGKNLKIWCAKVIEASELPNGTKAGCAGMVVYVDKKSFIVETGQDFLEIKELQLAGKKRMATDAFLRGYRLELGTELGVIAEV
ncbi:MAG: methionyl-tRNA formyltransferase [Lachnospiraceae bacterium]|nr:methionyl-tRNA formyltransferase [Lachnospiraceae bacterium]